MCLSIAPNAFNNWICINGFLFFSISAWMVFMCFFTLTLSLSFFFHRTHICDNLHMCWYLENCVDSIIGGMYFDWIVSTASNSTNSIDAWKQWPFLFHRKWNCSKFLYCFNEKSEKQLENQPTTKKNAPELHFPSYGITSWC